MEFPEALFIVLELAKSAAADPTDQWFREGATEEDFEKADKEQEALAIVARFLLELED